MRWRFELQHDSQNSGLWTPVEEPVGWNEIEISFSRNPKWHGILHEFGLSQLEFVGVGAKFITDVLQHIDGSADAKIGIRIYQDAQQNPIPPPVFEGKLNLFEYDKGVSYEFATVKARIEQNDQYTRFQQRLNIKVDLANPETVDSSTPVPAPSYAPYSGNQLYPLKLHSKSIARELFTTPSEFQDLVKFTDQSPIGTDPFCFDKRRFVMVGGATPAFRNDFGSGYKEFGYFWDNETLNQQMPIFEADRGGQYTFEICNWSFRLTNYVSTNSPDWSCTDNQMEQSELKVWFKVEGNPPVLLASSVYNFCHYVNSLNTTVSMPPQTYTLTAGQRAYLYFEVRWRICIRLTITKEFTDFFLFLRSKANDDTCFSVKNSQQSSGSKEAKVVLAYEALNRVTHAITEGQLSVASDLFARSNTLPYTAAYFSCASRHAITTGLFLRGFNLIQDNPRTVSCCDASPPSSTQAGIDRPKIEVSMEDLLNAENAVWNIGYGFEDDTVRIEEKHYFYQSDILLTVINPAEYNEGIYEQGYYNRILGGYEKWETESSFGIDEFNSRREYTRALKYNNKETQETRCKFIAGGYAIELTRRQGIQTTGSQDFRFDKDLFIICVEHHDVTRTERGTSTNIVGSPAFGLLPIGHPRYSPTGNIVDYATAYNLRISPERNLQRWFPILLAHQFKSNRSGLKRVYSEGNSAEALVANDACCTEISPESDNYAVDMYDANGSFILSQCHKPYYYLNTLEFDYPLSWVQYLSIKQNPYGRIRVIIKNETRYYYILQLRYKPNQGMCNFKLILAYNQSESTVTVYFNEEINVTCPAPTVGGSYTVPAGMFSSTISQLDANAQAFAYGLTFLNCQYGNEEITVTCPDDNVGDSVTIPANTYFASTQSAANALAQAAATAALNCGPLLYGNEEVTVYCPDGTIGDPVTVAANTFFSPISQADANQIAEDYAQSQLNCIGCPDTPVADGFVTVENLTTSTVYIWDFTGTTLLATLPPTAVATFSQSIRYSLSGTSYLLTNYNAAQCYWVSGVSTTPTPISGATYFYFINPSYGGYVKLLSII